MSDIDQTIIDSTKPNAGRIYDYLLGGHHNYEIDREMGDKLKKIAPVLPEIAKYGRWFLHEAILRACKWGFTQFLDFASGLPVEDHIHKNTPEGTKVIYSDIDPITVQYGRKIIGENPLVKYEVCNAGTPEKLLESDIVKSLFKENHKTAIGYSGILWFLSDEQISHAMKILYDWADEGSIIYLTDADSNDASDIYKEFMQIYKGMNQPFFLRTKETLIGLVKPWKVKEPGLLPYEKWYDQNPTVTESTAKVFGGTGSLSGFLYK